MEFLGEELAVGQAGEVFGDVDAGGVEFEKFDLLGILSGAEDEAEGRGFTGLLFVFGQPAEVEFHLAFEFSFEVAQLEIDGDESLQAAVVKEEVEVKVVLADLHPELAGLTDSRADRRGNRGTFLK